MTTIMYFFWDGWSDSGSVAESGPPTEVFTAGTRGQTWKAEKRGQVFDSPKRGQTFAAEDR